MKKALMIFVLALFLSWCSHKSNIVPVLGNTWNMNPIELITQEVKTFWLIQDTTYAEYPSHFSWCILLSPTQLAAEPNDTTWISAGIWDTFYTCNEVYGYDHIYSVPFLWIKITYDQNYSIDLSLFLKKDMKPFLATNADAIYSLSNPDIFIKLLKKDTLETPDQIVQNMWYTADCKYSLNTGRKKPDQNILVYDSSCPDEKWTSSRYIFSKIKTDYYYQQTYIESCAPPPCDVLDLNTIELFLK